jgi:SOS-response transcriptional repressor LexA
MMDEPKDRIAKARRLRGYDQAKQAANAAGWEYEAYKQIENGNRNLTVRWAAKIGRFYGVRPGWLLYGEPPMSGRVDTNLSDSLAYREIPRLSWSEIKNTRDIQRGIEMAQSYTSAPAEIRASDLSFALYIPDDSMATLDKKPFSLSEGDEIICDPIADVRPGDFVVAYVETIGHAVFRQFRIAAIHADGRQEIKLVPLNPAYPVLTIIDGESGHVVAKVIRFSLNAP